MAVKTPAHIREQEINELPNITFVRWLDGYRNAHSKAVVRCAVDGHEWSARVSKLLNDGTGCRQCAADKKRIPAEVRIEQINALPNVTFVRWLDGYRDNRSKAVVRCAVDGFEWSASVNNLLDKGRGCPQCAGQRRWTAGERVEQIDDLPNITFVRWDGKYRNNESKAVCRCDVDGFEWSASVNNLLNGGKGCPQCGRRSTRDKLTTSREKYESKIAEKGIGQYRFVKWVEGIHRGNRSKVLLKCTVDGFEWETAVSHVLSGKGCPQCAGVRRWTSDERIRQINEAQNLHFIRWDGEYTINESKAVCRCDVCAYEWSARVSTLIKGHGCPQCVGKRRWTADERVGQINNLPNATFVRWADGKYRGTHSKAVCRCDANHEWSATVGSLVSLGTGCPQCVTSGYNPSKPGTLYALRSECGTMVKIGISNNYERRHRELTKTTPFSWDCTELLHGDGALIASLEKAFHGMTEPVEFTEPFPGYTEWRKWTPELVDWFNTWREMT